MINIIIWFAAFLCSNPDHTVGNNGSCSQVQTDSTPNNADGDTGGETGGTPKPPPPPPPPGG